MPTGPQVENPAVETGSATRVVPSIRSTRSAPASLAQTVLPPGPRASETSWEPGAAGTSTGSSCCPVAGDTRAIRAFSATHMRAVGAEHDPVQVAARGEATELGDDGGVRRREQ